jgi:hypothetical protein
MLPDGEEDCLSCRNVPNRVMTALATYRPELKGFCLCCGITAVRHPRCIASVHQPCCRTLRRKGPGREESINVSRVGRMVGVDKDSL